MKYKREFKNFILFVILFFLFNILFDSTIYLDFSIIEVDAEPDGF
jgi:hypothetical protein